MTGFFANREVSNFNLMNHNYMHVKFCREYLINFEICIDLLSKPKLYYYQDCKFQVAVNTFYDKHLLLKFSLCQFEIFQYNLCQLAF